MSKQSKSFFTLMLLTSVLVIGVYKLSNTYSSRLKLSNLTGYSSAEASAWQDFRDNQSNISFKYPEKWEVKRYIINNDKNLHLINLSPHNGSEDIKIYVSNTGFYAISNLPSKEVLIAGQKGISIDNQIFAVKQGSKYYTIDLGNSIDNDPTLDPFLTQIAFR